MKFNSLKHFWRFEMHKYILYPKVFFPNIFFHLLTSWAQPLMFFLWIGCFCRTLKCDTLWRGYSEGSEWGGGHKAWQKIDTFNSKEKTPIFLSFFWKNAWNRHFLHNEVKKSLIFLFLLPKGASIFKKIIHFWCFDPKTLKYFFGPKNPK